MFTVNKESAESSLKYFTIDSETDLIQKDVIVKNIEVEVGTYGKQLKITIGKDEAETYQWIAQEPGGDKVLPNGKTLTQAQQEENVVKTIAHIGRRFLGEDFSASGTSFDGICNDLIKQTKPLWEKTKLNAKFEINAKGYAGLCKYVPFLEIEGEGKLKIYQKDRDSLKNRVSTKSVPDSEPDEVDSIKKEVSSDLPF